MRLFFILFILTISISSLTDEATQTILSLQINEQDGILPLVFILYMIGGIVATPLSRYLLHPKTPIKNLIYIFSTQGSIIYITYFLSSTYFIFIISFFLGTTGNLLWIEILSIIPLFQNKNSANKVAHTCRNIGFITGPLLGSFLFTLYNQYSFFILSIITFIPIMFLFGKNNFLFYTTKKNVSKNSNDIKYDKYNLFKNTKVKKVLIPTALTILSTSNFNILIIPYITKINNFPNYYYGTLLSIISFGLIISPILLSDLFKKIGTAAGASAGTLLIGLGVFSIGYTNNFLIMLIFSLILGLGNGIQNTLLSLFLYETFPNNSEKSVIPSYVAYIQITVLFGFILSFLIKDDYIKDYFLYSGFFVITTSLVSIFINKRRGI
ncbi:MFS transporter [Gallibacterium anatis]|uniref:MFS transporter n=1 Tax=Gallibacterium anatis TaxID=750 RepID=UPI0039FC2C89